MDSSAAVEPAPRRKGGSSPGLTRLGARGSGGGDGRPVGVGPRAVVQGRGLARDVNNQPPCRECERGGAGGSKRFVVTRLRRSASRGGQTTRCQAGGAASAPEVRALSMRSGPHDVRGTGAACVCRDCWRRGSAAPAPEPRRNAGERSCAGGT